MLTVLRDDQLCLHCDPGSLSRLPHWDRRQPCGETIHFSISAKTPKFKNWSPKCAFIWKTIYKNTMYKIKIQKKRQNTICAVLQRWANLWDADEWFAGSHFVEHQGCIFFPQSSLNFPLLNIYEYIDIYNKEYTHFVERNIGLLDLLQQRSSQVGGGGDHGKLNCWWR